MYSKRKMCCLIATCSLLVCMFRAEIFAKGNEQQELPEIIRWEEGRGFDEQGEQIVGSWAYDTVNVEGKYVLFNDMGNVSAKTDQWKERETYAENFTDTEQATATLALRTEYFPKFTGTVYITIQKENGESRQYELSPDNLYEQNVAVNNGVYKVKAVEAVDEQYIYKTEYAKDVLEMEQNQLLLLKINVTKEKTGTVAEAEKRETKMVEKAGTRNVADRENRIEILLKEGSTREKYVLCGCILLAAVLGIGLLFRKKKNQYDYQEVVKIAQREKVDVYTIPPNFAQEGTIFSGRVRLRNAFEAGVLALLLFQLLMATNLSVKGKIYAGIIVMIPVVIFAVLGVQGESLTSFLFQFLKYLRGRRILTVPDGKYRLKRNRRLRKQQYRSQSGKGGERHRKRGKRIKTSAKRSKTDGKTES